MRKLLLALFLFCVTAPASSWLFIAATSGPYVDVRSLSFNGSTQYVDLGAHALYAATDTFAWSFWFKPAADNSGVIGTYNSGASGWSIYFAGLKISLYMQGTGLINVNYDTALTLNAWHHVVWCYPGTSDATNIKVWVDGSPKTVRIFSNTLTVLTNLSGHLNFARHPGGDSYYNGLLDGVAEGRGSCPSDADVTSLYNGGVAGDVRLSSYAPNIVGWWPIGELLDTSSLIFDPIGGVTGTLTSGPPYSVDIP